MEFIALFLMALQCRIFRCNETDLASRKNSINYKKQGSIPSQKHVHLQFSCKGWLFTLLKRLFYMINVIF